MSVPVDPLTSEIPTERSAAEPHARRTSRSSDVRDVEKLGDRVYGFTDISSYPARDRFLIRAGDLFFYWLIRTVCSTLRWEVRGREHLDSILKSGHVPIFTSWHSCLLSATWFWRNRGIVVMSSTSRDAEYTSRVIKRFGFGTARGSATRGGLRALVEMAQCLENRFEAGFTIDGPRGPAYVAKPGAVTLARHSGQPILPFHISASRFVELPSWDRLQIPVPFARAVTLIAEPIYVSHEGGAAESTTKQAAVQSVLDGLRADGESWRKQAH